MTKLAIPAAYFMTVLIRSPLALHGAKDNILIFVLWTHPIQRPFIFFFLMNRPPPISPLFPPTTPFRSGRARSGGKGGRPFGAGCGGGDPPVGGPHAGGIDGGGHWAPGIYGPAPRPPRGPAPGAGPG